MIIQFSRINTTFLITGLILLIVIVIVSSKNKSALSCNEYPFNSIDMPLKDVDSIISYEINGSRSAVFIKVIDNSNQEFYFAVLCDSYNKSILSILKNLPLSWNDYYNDLGLDTQGGQAIPGYLFNENNQFEKISNITSGYRDLIQILSGSQYKNSNAEAYKYLKSLNLKNPD